MTKMKNSSEQTPVGDVGNLLDKKIALFREYLSVTEELRARMPAEDFEDMKDLLVKREILIQRVDGLNDDLERARKPSLCMELPEPLRLLQGTAKGLLEKTASIESECATKIAGLRDKLREEIREKNGGHRIRHTYGPSTFSAPRFMDIKH
jgi:hypothetical protein